VPDELFALGKLQLCILVVRLFLDNGFEVSEGIARVEDGRVGHRTPPVGLFRVSGLLRLCGARSPTLIYEGSISSAFEASAIA
jgi:hypothetical protein